MKYGHIHAALACALASYHVHSGCRDQAAHTVTLTKSHRRISPSCDARLFSYGNVMQRAPAVVVEVPDAAKRGVHFHRMEVPVGRPLARKDQPDLLSTTGYRPPSWQREAHETIRCMCDSLHDDTAKLGTPCNAVLQTQSTWTSCTADTLNCMVRWLASSPCRSRCGCCPTAAAHWLAAKRRSAPYNSYRHLFTSH